MDNIRCLRVVSTFRKDGLQLLPSRLSLELTTKIETVKKEDSKKGTISKNIKALKWC